MGTAFVVSLTALSSLYATPEMPAQEVSYIGCHFAFIGMLLLISVIAILILIFVRDKKKTSMSAAVESGAIPGIDRPWLVSDIMNTNPSILPATAKIRDAIAIMQETETNGVPLVDDAGKVVGFLSDGDILKYLSRHESSQTDGVSYIIMLETDSFQDRIRSVYDLDAMRLALKRAALQPEDIDFIILHGTGTKQNDAMESKAVHALFGDSTPAASLKRAVGHQLAGAGAFSAAVAYALLAAVREKGEAPLPLNAPAALARDPALPPLDLVEKPCSRPLRRILVNAFAFGGSNISLIIEAAANEPDRDEATP